MNVRRFRDGIFALCSLFLAGCNRSPGTPRVNAEAVRPDEIKDFSRLYASNCSACHGRDGQNGPAIALANSTYQAIVDEDRLRSVITNGEHGTLMPAFAQSAGGLLTAEQVDVLVKGIRSNWYKADALKGLDVPPYKVNGQGDVARGQQVFTADCARCHGSEAQQESAKAGSVTDGSYLALVNDQALRAIIIAGRPDLGHPDWRSAAPGHPMSDQDVTDVVAWMASQRLQTPGQPYPSQQLPAEGEKDHE
jgi:cytochrome c oxidase cbb3-type subunit 3/ubiquinol-cytochrome c reductase cytochrome c subunit